MMAFTKLFTIAFAFQNKASPKWNQRHGQNVHQSIMASKSTTPDTLQSFDGDTTSDSVNLTSLCLILDVASPHDLLSSATNPVTGIRGVYTNHPISTGDIILKLPLTSCIVDTNPPLWLQTDDAGSHNPSDWATRLAASVLDLPPCLWKELLPDPVSLHSSLPIHWSEDVLSSAQCTALELAVDSAYFARAQAVADLMDGLVNDDMDMDNDSDVRHLKQQCENALDIVQTRSCRLDGEVRVLAPLFDLINHGGADANAYFGQEGDYLVVRAKKDIGVSMEVLIDYGNSAKPAWKCLVSYGFVGDQQGDGNTAEVCVNGTSYDVGPTTIPYELVKAEEQVMKQHGMVTGNEYNDELELTPLIAMNLAKQISDVALQLVLDHPKSVMTNDIKEEDPEYAIPRQLAASLCSSHHRILLDCAMKLRDWAAGRDSPDLSGILP